MALPKKRHFCGRAYRLSNKGPKSNQGSTTRIGYKGHEQWGLPADPATDGHGAGWLHLGYTFPTDDPKELRDRILSYSAS